MSESISQFYAIEQRLLLNEQETTKLAKQIKSTSTELDKYVDDSQRLVEITKTLYIHALNWHRMATSPTSTLDPETKAEMLATTEQYIDLYNKLFPQPEIN